MGSHRQARLRRRDKVVREVVIAGQRSQRSSRDVPHRVVRIVHQQGQIWRHPAGPRYLLRGRPAHCLRRNRALARVAFQKRDERGGDAAIVIVQVGLGRAVPFEKVFRAPFQCLVEMTEIARVGPACGHRGLYRGAADLMAANRFQQAVSGEGHVAVVAGAAR